MPAEDGKLSEAERETVRAWLTLHRSPGKCESCGTQEWVLESHLAFVGSRVPGAFGHSTVYPVVVLSCSFCGNFRLYPALKIGIVKNDAQGMLILGAEANV